MAFFLIGIVAGVLSGVFGIGGGVVLVPAMILLLGLRPQLAVGTSLGALLLPVGALGAWQYYRSGDVQMRSALLIALGILLGAWAGARIGVHLSPRLLQRSFAVFLVAIAVQLWWKA